MPSYRAYWALHEDRDVHFGGEGFIPSVAILAEAIGKDLDYDDLKADVRHMDRVYLKRQGEVREAERARSERAAKTKGMRRERR